jgi:hypothetical protein
MKCRASFGLPRGKCTRNSRQIMARNRVGLEQITYHLHTIIAYIILPFDITSDVPVMMI